MPRRRQTPARPTAAPGDVVPPPELRAGACIEVWSDPPGNGEWSGTAVNAFRRYSNARDAWLAAHGLSRRDESAPASLQGTSTPWSFYYMAEHRPDDLQRRLREADLPADWTPVRVGG